MKRILLTLTILLLSTKWCHAQPLVYDCMNYTGKPDLGARQDMKFLYEFALTLRDEQQQTGSGSSMTIEPASVRGEAARVRDASFIVVDIESLGSWNNDAIRGRYIELVQRTAFDSRVAWWNLGPADAPNLTIEQYRHQWQGAWQLREPLIRQVDFIVLAMYFKGGEPYSSWANRNLPRIEEARRLAGRKPVFVALCPNIGRPAGIRWPFLSESLMGSSMDAVAQYCDGIVLWYAETPPQAWSDQIPALSAIRSRIGAGGVYRDPAPVLDPPGG